MQSQVTTSSNVVHYIVYRGYCHLEKNGNRGGENPKKSPINPKNQGPPCKSGRRVVQDRAQREEEIRKELKLRLCHCQHHLLLSLDPEKNIFVLESMVTDAITNTLDSGKRCKELARRPIFVPKSLLNTNEDRPLQCVQD